MKKCIEKGSVVKPQKGKRNRMLILSDEKDFFKLIEKRLKKQGFKVIETSIPTSKKKIYKNVYP